MQHYGVNGYSLHAMNSLSAMYNLHQQAAQQAQHAPDYRPSVHALTLAERLAGKNNSRLLPFPGGKKPQPLLLAPSETLWELERDIANGGGVLLYTGHVAKLCRWHVASGVCCQWTTVPRCRLASNGWGAWGWEGTQSRCMGLKREN